MHAMPSLLVLALTVAALAGCVDERGHDVVLRDSLLVGERLFDFSDPDFTLRGTAPESGARRISPQDPLVVGDGIETLGVTFQGAFAWSNSTATLTLARPDGSDALRLEAAPGRDDSMGTIGAIFAFHESTPALAGEWQVTMEARGNVSSVDFSVHGIERRPEPMERPFNVTRDATELEVRIDARGWGPPPSVLLVGPDDERTTIALGGGREAATQTGATTAGEHRLRVEPNDWGGTLIVQVRAH